jgi:NTP pyrophosphatase (non-canonical NTP hydrolase)
MDSFKDYQARAMDTAVYQSAVDSIAASDLKVLAKLSYTSLGLAGEAGELANKIKKLLRRDSNTGSYFTRAELCDELGDVLWYVAAMASELGYSLDEIAARNVEKLEARAANDTIKGSGDTVRH